MRRVLTVLTLVAFTPVVHADPPNLWPAFRHDAQRTARATGRGVMTSAPQPAWILPSGGRLAGPQSALADIDGDGRTEIVLASAGAIIVRRSDDTIVSRSPLIGADTVFGVWDLDHDGTPEVVAHGTSPRGVYAIDARTGAVRWHVDVTNASIGVTAYPRTAGFDLVVRDYTDRGVLSYYGTSNGLSSTSAGWTSYLNDYDIDRSLAIGDLDGDGTAELVAPNDRGFVVIDLATGNAIGSAVSTIPDAGYFPAYYFNYTLANVDGVPGDEIVAVDTSYYYSEDASLSVLAFNRASSTLRLVWQRFLHNDVTTGVGNDVATHFISFLAEGAADLDNDGHAEIVFSQWDRATSGAGGTWTSYVVDGATGTQVAMLANTFVSAVADIDGDGKPEIVARAASDVNSSGTGPTPLFATLRAYDFDGRASGAVDKGWTLDNAAVVALPAYRYPHGALDAGGYSPGSLLASAHQNIDATGDAAPELYVYFNRADEFANMERATDIEAVHGADGQIRALWSIPAGTYATVVALGQHLATTSSLAEALVAVNDGRARVISNTFMESGHATEGNFAPLPSVVSLDGTHAMITLVRSDEYLAYVDPTQTVGIEPYVPRRIQGVIQTASRGYISQPGFLLPVNAPTGGNYFVVHAHSHTDWQDHSYVALDANGGEHWRVEVGHRRSPAGFDNSVTADWNGDATPDFFVSEINETGGEDLVVRDGIDGHTVRSVTVGPMLSASGESVNVGAYFQGYALTDVNGDAVPDIVGALHPQWFAAIDVSHDPIHSLWVRIGTSTAPLVNGQAMIAPMAADGSDRILRVNSQNAYGNYTRLTFDGTIEAQVAPAGVMPMRDAMDPNTAAFVLHDSAPTRFDFVTAGATGDATGMLSRYDGAAMTLTWSRYLTGGMSVTTRPASPSALLDPIVADADGDGTDDVLVGSEDGHLYVVHAADGTLMYAVDLRAPVDHVLAANLDLDADLEILCSVRDGTIVALDAAGRYSWTAVPTPDAGMMNMDASTEDVVATTDGGGMDASMRDGSTADAGTGGGSGCGCRTPARSSDSKFALIALGAVMLCRRRSHRGMKSHGNEGS